MRKVMIAAAILLALSGCRSANAADKGAPATLQEIMSMPERGATSCYVETSVAGTFLKAGPRESQAGAGLGCDVQAANLILGAGLRADFADWQNTGSLFAKIGIVINSGVHLYGLAEWKIPEWKVKDAGQLALGAGSELRLSIINPNLWLFGEGTYAATKWGIATRDDMNVRLGLRYKF